MPRYPLIVTLACLAPLVGAFAQDATNREEYRPPEGFGGYTWTTPLGKFDRLTPDPVYVRIAASSGQVTDFDFDCFEQGGGSECRESAGSGFFALAEYYVDSQGFRISGADDGKAVLFPVTYQFCTQWKGFSNEFRGDALERMQLCGVRLHFRSDTAAQEQANPDPTYKSSYTRILNWLVRMHGEPEDYERQGIVIVPGQATEPQVIQRAPSGDRYRNWYWCRPKGEELAPRCSASIVYTFDAETGRGQVIYLTPAVWMYAYARQYGGSEDDPLYRVLHGGVRQPRVDHQCSDSFICQPLPPKPMSEKMLARFRVPAKTADAKNPGG